MKKNTTKKVKVKVASKPKPAAGKSAASSKLKIDAAAKSRGAAVATQDSSLVSTKKLPAGKVRAAAAVPMVPGRGKESANGRAPQEPGRKPRKGIEPKESEAKKPAPPPAPLPPPVKTYLTAKELKDFKGLLLDKRAELAGDVERLTSEALKGKSGGVNEQSTMPIHMADLGTDTWEQDFTLGLIANEQALVREIDDALARIEDKTYGMCVATDKPISKERLRAKPWAKYCIEYARLREEGRAP